MASNEEKTIGVNEGGEERQISVKSKRISFTLYSKFSNLMDDQSWVDASQVVQLQR